MSKNRKHNNKFEHEYFWQPPATDNQRALIESIQQNTITFATGPAGVGKTFIALQEALKLLNARQIDKIYYVRNNCGFSDLGSKGRGELPGNILDKARPLLGPIVDNLAELVDQGKANYMIEKGIIEPLLYEDLIGRSLTYSFIIADEAASVTSKGMLALLSRVARGSKLVVVGDTRQKATSSQFDDGISDAVARLQGLKGIGFVQFTKADIQRHGLLCEILTRYGY